MISATIFEAKTRLSELVRRAQQGEEVIITSGRKKTPVARLTPVNQVTSPRLGFMQHLGIKLPDSFFDPLPEDELRLWEGEGE